MTVVFENKFNLSANKIIEEIKQYIKALLKEYIRSYNNPNIKLFEKDVELFLMNNINEKGQIINKIISLIISDNKYYTNINLCIQYYSQIISFLSKILLNEKNIVNNMELGNEKMDDFLVEEIIKNIGNI